MARKPPERGAEAFEIALVLVAIGVCSLWLRFNAAPGRLAGEAWKMAAQSDLIAYYLPMTELAAGRLAQFELPLWNPHVCSGVPLLATLQTGVFFPASWLAIWLPAHQAIAWGMTFACFAAGWLAAAAFRALGHGEVASATGGVLYVFACVVGQVLWPPAAWSLVFVPALLLCVAKCLTHPERELPLGWWIALVVTVALQLLAGFPQYAAYGFLVVSGFAVVRLLETLRGGSARAGSAARRGATLAAAVLLGAALAAVQLVPTAELAAKGERLAADSPAALQYLTLLDPRPATAVLRAVFDPSPGLVSFHLGRSGGYLGIVTLLLAGVAVASDWRRGRTWLWLGLGATALALSDGFLGGAAPLYRAWVELPVLGTFRTPERLRVVTFFCVIALAVVGFDRLRAAGAGAPGRRRLSGTVVALALVLAAGMTAVGQAAGCWRVVAGAGLALAVVGAPGGLRRSAEIALFALVVIDVSIATGEYGSLREIPVELSQRYAGSVRSGPLPEGFFETQRDELGPARMALLHYRPRMATSPSDGGYRPSCYEPLAPGDWAHLDRILTGRPGTGAALFDLDPEQAATFYDVAGVVRVIEPADDGPRVRENGGALPRAYVIASYRVESQAQVFQHLRRGDVDFTRTVLLEQDPGLPPAGEDREPGLVPARIESYEAERVVVEAEAAGPALLVLSDSDYPGWRARVDGEEAPILRANGLYRAVRIRGGRHRVVFEYVPASLRLGAAISGGALAVLAGVGVAARRRRQV